SRQAVRNIVNDIRDCISVEGYCAIIERLKKLPSVNPQYTGNEFFNFDTPMVKKSMEQDTVSKDMVLDKSGKWIIDVRKRG
ncbi:MAG: hypothetical protein J6S85_16940, partial [Methanobrevibacter sp.]|nr:hypothetical protein [Methanobrevibacter sp.]